jgi:hypothetical protein
MTQTKHTTRKPRAHRKTEFGRVIDMRLKRFMELITLAPVHVYETDDGWLMICTDTPAGIAKVGLRGVTQLIGVYRVSEAMSPAVLRWALIEDLREAGAL